MWKDKDVNDWTVDDFKTWYKEEDLSEPTNESIKLSEMAAKRKLPFEAVLIEYEEGKCYEYTRECFIVYKIGGEYFVFEYDKSYDGLCDEFYVVPYKVRPVEKVIETTKWVCVDE